MHRRIFVPLTAAAIFGMTAAMIPAAANAAPPPTSVATAGVPASNPHAGLPSVYPVPQSIAAHGHSVTLGEAVAVVATADTDASAITAVKAVLTAAGVGNVYQVTDPAAVHPQDSAIYLGSTTANPAVAQALQALGVTDAAGLAADGYVLASGKVNGRAAIVLNGHDATGTYYAVQTMRQLVTTQGNHAVVPGVTVRDWPDQTVRGVIEGFYGTPWSHDQRLAQLDFYGAHKMNAYVYSPKDDPLLRAQWRDSYPPAKLAQIKELVDRAIADHVEFTYALSPGLSVCYSSASDEKALVDKFQSLWDIGVRTFSIPLDDVSYTTWNCAADQTKFGSGGGAAGEAQAYLLNQVQKDFIDTHPGASRLEMVPTEYSNLTVTPYKTAIKNDLSSKIVVGWTGVGVIAPTITTAQAKAANEVFGHDILLWDNYPVNDYVTDRLLLGPYVGRDAGLDLYGITANPMIQPEASKIALFNVADYSWNGGAYDPQASWQASLTELSGGDPQARAALAAFADLEYSSRIDTVQAPVLAKMIKAFWSAFNSGKTDAAAALDDYLKVIEGIPNTLAARMNDPEFVTETKPWLDSAGYWGQSARAALRMLVDARAGDGAAVIADRADATALMAKAKSFQYKGLGGTVNVTVGDGVIDTFITDALSLNDRWLGLAGRHTTAITSLPTYQTNVPANMVDGDDSTYFWSSAAPAVGDYVGVDLGTIQPISAVSVHMSKPSSPSDYLHGAELEYSSNGSSWTGVKSFVNQTDIEATLPSGVQARYVRLRSTGSQSNWVVVREFTVTGPDNARLIVTGSPAAASGSSLAAAADGNADTAYTAAAKPAAGDALVVALPKARPLDRVAVIGTGNGKVQISAGGGDWTTIGTLTDTAYTELDANGQTADAIRLLWTAGSAAPSVAEVVPWYSDVPVAELTVAPDAVDVQLGADTTVTATLSATRAYTVSGTLSAAPPSDVSAAPKSAAASVLRGGQTAVDFTLAGTKTGTFKVPLTFTPSSGDPVTTTVTLNVRPKVSDTNVALASNGGVATASSTEDGLAQFTPDHAIDGDSSTRWSSDHSDDQWLQVQFASAQHLGKIVLSWETAHATEYNIETSTDGTTWTTAAHVTASQGGTETVWIDQANVQYLRMQGLGRSTVYGYSIYELQAYPVVS